MSILTNITDRFKASEFDVKGQMKVKNLKKVFKNSFGCTLRVYSGNRFAKEDYTLKRIRDKNNPGTGEEFKVRASWTVSEVEKIFHKSFGIRVQVANNADNELAKNDLTLGEVKRNN